MKKELKQPPFANLPQPVWQVGQWPARWISAPGVECGPVVMMFRLVVELPKPQTILVHVSADERYIFSVNGQELGRGPERGSLEEWFFESYDIRLNAGRNLLTAKVWAAGDARPHAQISAGPAFLLATESTQPDLSTGCADWEVAVLHGYAFKPATICWGRGGDTVVDGTVLNWERNAGEGDAWSKAEKLAHAFAAGHTNECPLNTRMLAPATLPAMKMTPREQARVVHARYRHDAIDNQIRLEDSDATLAKQLQDWWRGHGVVELPPSRTLECILDFEDYVCAYNAVTVSGGREATIDLLWAESLFKENNPNAGKGNRDEIDRKYFIGEGDSFVSGGGARRSYEGLWWHAGRYLMLRVKTGAESIRLDRLRIIETGYPFDFKAEYRFSCPQVTAIVPIMKRALEMCSHETLMDCPYYEQMMYVGDTRLELLSLYTLTNDDRLPRKAIKMLNKSRDFQGRISSRYPSKLRQLIVGFDLYWIGMVYDFALWRGDRKFVRDLMPAVHTTLDHFLTHLNQANLLTTPVGWNFMDWVPEWKSGVPPTAADGLCASLNFLLVHVLKLAAELDEWLGEPAFAALYRAKAATLAQAARMHFWSEQNQMFADDSDKRHYSEHTQCFAILGGELGPKQEALILNQVVNSPTASRSTIYFSHYLFECAYRLKHPKIFFERLERDWFILPEMGFKTTYETPAPSRSDCHAWGAHPLYHYYASVIGLRPAAFGSDELRCDPMLGELAWIDATLPSRQGVMRITASDVALKRGKLPVPTVNVFVPNKNS
jgi:hypothetical protein